MRGAAAALVNVYSIQQSTPCYYANAVTTDNALGYAEAPTGSPVYKEEEEEVERAGSPAMLSSLYMAEDLGGKQKNKRR